MPSLRYALRLDEGREHPRVAWLGQSPLNATALLASGMGSDPVSGAGRPAATAVGRAGIWLRATLSAGPRPVLDVFREAEDEGITEAALHRAFAQGGFMRARRGAGKGSFTVWGLVEAAADEGARYRCPRTWHTWRRRRYDRYAIFAHHGNDFGNHARQGANERPRPAQTS